MHHESCMRISQSCCSHAILSVLGDNLRYHGSVGEQSGHPFFLYVPLGTAVSHLVSH